MRGRFLVGAGIVQLDDANALGGERRHEDFAFKTVADCLESTDVSHVSSPFGFEPATIAASMAIDRPGTNDAAPACGPERSGGRRR
jgi:hypothetical protein